MSFYWEYFVRIQTPVTSDAPSSKLIPALQLERCEFTHDKLGFTLHLLPGAEPEFYDEPLFGENMQKLERKSSIWKKLNPFTNDDEGDDVWPMNFESEHVKKIVDIFRKVQEYAIDK